MLRRTKALLFLLIIPMGAISSEGNLTVDAKPAYVSVSIELHGLEESAQVLRKSLERVNQTLQEFKINGGETLQDPETRAALERLLEKSLGLLQAIDKTLANTGTAITNAKEPSTQLLQALIEETNTNAIEPTLNRIDTMVSGWIAVILFGMFTAFIIIVWGLFTSIKRLKEIAEALSKIPELFELVPRRPTD